MDIDLLSKMVKELILDNDRVVLPGLGAFVAEIVPSTFSDKGYTINPPYRRLSFRSKPDDGDLLIRFYAASNGVDMEVAGRIVREFVMELKSVLHARKLVVFPDLGRLRATKENNVFFIADENLDIFPAGFGLKPVSMKTHKESKEEVAAAVEGLASFLANDVDNVSRAGALPVGESESKQEVSSKCVELQSASQTLETEDAKGIGNEVAEAVGVGVCNDAESEDVGGTGSGTASVGVSSGFVGRGEDRIEGVVLVEANPEVVLEYAEGSSEIEGASSVAGVDDKEVEVLSDSVSRGEERIEGVVLVEANPEVVPEDAEGSSEIEGASFVAGVDDKEVEVLSDSVGRGEERIEGVVLVEANPEVVPKDVNGSSEVDGAVMLEREEGIEPVVEPTRKAGRKALAVVAVVVGIAAIFLLVFMLLGRVAPELVDKLLYSPDDLEILYYKF